MTGNEVIKDRTPPRMELHGMRSFFIVIVVSVCLFVTITSIGILKTYSKKYTGTDINPEKSRELRRRGIDSILFRGNITFNHRSKSVNKSSLLKNFSAHRLNRTSKRGHLSEQKGYITKHRSDIPEHKGDVIKHKDDVVTHSGDITKNKGDKGQNGGDNLKRDDAMKHNGNVITMHHEVPEDNSTKNATSSSEQFSFKQFSNRDTKGVDKKQLEDLYERQRIKSSSGHHKTLNNHNDDHHSNVKNVHIDNRTRGNINIDSPRINGLTVPNEKGGDVVQSRERKTTRSTNYKKDNFRNSTRSLVHDSEHIEASKLRSMQNSKRNISKSIKDYQNVSSINDSPVRTDNENHSRFGVPRFKPDGYKDSQRRKTSYVGHKTSIRSKLKYKPLLEKTDYVIDSKEPLVKDFKISNPKTSYS